MAYLASRWRQRNARNTVNTCRSGTEASPHLLRRPTRALTNDGLYKGTPKNAAKLSVGTPDLYLAIASLLAATTKTSLTLVVHTLLPFPEFAPVPDEFTVARVDCARHLTLCCSGTWPLSVGWQKLATWQPGAPPTTKTIASAASLNPNSADTSNLSQGTGPFGASLRASRHYLMLERRCETLPTDTLPTTVGRRPEIYSISVWIRILPGPSNNRTWARCLKDRGIFISPADSQSAGSRIHGPAGRDRPCPAAARSEE